MNIFGKSRVPKGPKGPKGPKKPQFFAAVDEKIVLKQFSITTKSYKDIKQKQTDEGLQLSGMPVFKSGRHRDFEYTPKWIDQFLIGQFDKDEDIPIQRDHSDESYATLGYVTNLYREGDMVYADMNLIDETAISRWKKGLMKKWSVGITREFKLAEISAVAFPYIKEARVHSAGESEETLSLTLSKKDGKFSLVVQEGFDLGESSPFNVFCGSLMKRGACLVRLDKDETGQIFANYIEEGEFNMELEELKKANEALEAKNKQLQASVDEVQVSLKSKESEIENYKKSDEAAKFAALKSSVEKEIDSLIQAGKVIPARKNSLVDTMVKMGEDSRKEMIAAFSESGKIASLTETGSQTSEKQNGESFKDGEGKFAFDGKTYDLNTMSASEINMLAQQYGDKNTLGWQEAMHVIYAKARPKD